MSVEWLNITPKNKEHFKDSLKEFAFKKERLDAIDFAKESIRKFVNTEWRETNERAYGWDITKLQKDLQELQFFKWETDGKFWISTLAALVNFQKSRTWIAFDWIAWNDTKTEIAKALEEKKALVTISPTSIDLDWNKGLKTQKVIIENGVVRKPESLETFPWFPQKKWKEILEVIANPQYISYNDGLLKGITNSVSIEDVVEPKIQGLYIKLWSERNGLTSWKVYRLVWDVSANTYVFHKSNADVYSDFPKQLLWKKVLINNKDQIIPSEDTDIAWRKKYEERLKIAWRNIDIPFLKKSERNLDENDREYFYKYMRVTQEISKEDFPETASPLLEKFWNISLETIMSGLSNFPPKAKKKIASSLDIIQNAAREGVMRGAKSILKNDGHKLSMKDAFTVHITNRDRLLSFSITYNPIDWKLIVVPAWIWVNGFWDDHNSQETPLWTRRIAQSRVWADNEIMNPKWSPHTSMRYAATMATGIEKWLNSNMRDAVTHGISPERWNILKTAWAWLDRDEMRKWSWWCTTMEWNDSQKIIGLYRKVEKLGHRVYQETLPPIDFWWEILTSDISREQNIIFEKPSAYAWRWEKPKRDKVAKRKWFFSWLFG